MEGQKQGFHMFFFYTNKDFVSPARNSVIFLLFFKLQRLTLISGKQARNKWGWLLKSDTYRETFVLTMQLRWHLDISDKLLHNGHGTANRKSDFGYFLLGSNKLMTQSINYSLPTWPLSKNLSCGNFVLLCLVPHCYLLQAFVPLSLAKLVWMETLTCFPWSSEYQVSFWRVNTLWHFTPSPINLNLHLKWRKYLWNYCCKISCI